MENLAYIRIEFNQQKPNNSESVDTQHENYVKKILDCDVKMMENNVSK